MTVTPEQYYGIANKFLSVLKRFDNTERIKSEKPLLAHYTSMRVLERMIKDQEVWF